MEEKVIIQSKQELNIKIICIALIGIGLILGIVYSVNYSLFDGFDDYYWTSILPYCLGICLLPFAVIAGLLFAATRSELIVTDKRVYGKAMFGKRVDLPLDSISAIGTNFLLGVSVSTSSGRISFLGIKNRDDIHKEISKLLVARQDKSSATTIKQEVPQSQADELKKYKDLLDSGVISQEEFDAKKKQLLGL